MTMEKLNRVQGWNFVGKRDRIICDKNANSISCLGVIRVRIDFFVFFSEQKHKRKVTCAIVGRLCLFPIFTKGAYFWDKRNN